MVQNSILEVKAIITRPKRVFLHSHQPFLSDKNRHKESLIGASGSSSLELNTIDTNSRSQTNLRDESSKLVESKDSHDTSNLVSDNYSYAFVKGRCISRNFSRF